MSDENFKFFYKQEFEKRDILQLILLNCRSDFLRKVFSDNFFKFNKNNVMEFIWLLIEYFEIDNKRDEDERIKLF